LVHRIIQKNAPFSFVGDKCKLTTKNVNGWCCISFILKYYL